MEYKGIEQRVPLDSPHKGVRKFTQCSTDPLGGGSRLSRGWPASSPSSSPRADGPRPSSRAPSPSRSRWLCRSVSPRPASPSAWPPETAPGWTGLVRRPRRPRRLLKYPAYADYRASTSVVVPWFPKRRLDHGTRQGA